MKTYKIWITPKEYKLIQAPCPSKALEQIGHKVWKIEKGEKNG